jgi:uncharacterized alkaline shock family protein YloU
MSTSNPPEGPAVEGGDRPAAAQQADRGRTVIAENVVARVADQAAREIPGVHSLSGGVGGRLRRLAPGIGEANRAAAVEVGEKEAIVALDLVVDYGVSIPQLADAVRRNVIERVEHTTGLIVKEVNIEVTDLHFPDVDRDAEPTAPRVQ